MRFDDMLATVLGQAADRPDRCTARWRQLVDLLAQQRSGIGGEQEEAAYAWLRKARRGIDPEIRRQSARSLAGRAVDPDLVAFFAEDMPSIAAPLIGGVRLDSETWLGLLPRLGPAARSLLRHRQDLAPEVRAALGAFGPSDFRLEGGSERSAETPAPAPAGGDSQIRELVDRIEAYRQRREAQAHAPAAAANSAESFRWETGTDGVLVWVEGAPRGALVGQSIAWVAGRGQHGVDGQAAGGFEKRSPFRDARFTVAGEGPASGDWRISGIPFFDTASGAFQGYRGTARRPRPDEIAQSALEAVAEGVFGTEFPADSLRQLIHELRTPLNAIIGFAEMIEGQYMGPAAMPYRGRAATIMEQARSLLSAVDDLDTAARIESRRLELAEGATDAVALLARLHESYARVAAQRGAAIELRIEEGLPLARVEPGAAERMFGRLLAGTIGLAGEGEAIGLALGLVAERRAPVLQLSLGRPRAIAGLDERELLDPGYSPDGDWPGAPALGLGFALRLVRNLAEAAGGSLDVAPDGFILTLPAVTAETETPSRSEGSV
ncbi:MAG TPA: histidine kinase dimerization/phospho-acceptor domain-containing protein [Allosphingosinicella sp.]|nr:histidine kinase dimerization/phospho-acceptor domain-containing protein [Allosphingosinicella sp.]